MGKIKNQCRRSIRLDGYDYSQAGEYFVTVCVRGKQSVLSKIVNGQVVLTQIGEIVEECWNRIGHLKARLDLDEFVIMPNHFHGIIIIHDFGRGEALADPAVAQRMYPANASPLRVSRGTKPGSLGAIVQNFKSLSTRRINQNRGTPGKKFWQRGYYDRIIRNQQELNRIRKYISENPLNWEMDEYHPSRIR